jgi:hypothetical protein
LSAAALSITVALYGVPSISEQRYLSGGLRRRGEEEKSKMIKSLQDGARV